MSLRGKMRDKYFWMELLMLFSITYFIAIFSDVEYSIHEEGNGWLFIKSLEYRLSFGTFHFILYASYYWIFVRRFVDKRQPWLLFVSVLIFVPVIHYYNHYVANQAVIHLPFLSDELREMAKREFKSSQRFTVVYAYMLSSRCVPMIFFAYLLRSLKQENQLKVLKEQQLLAELNYLKAQLQPHFFFNTLNNIYALAIKASKSTAPMVLQLSEMMRYVLYQSGEKKVPLQQEIAFLKSYVEIERIRHADHAEIVFDIQGATENVLIEPLLLLPFVENAFKHGIREHITGGRVSIVICVMQDELNLQVSNTVPKNAHRENTPGIGIANVKKRLELLYPSRHRLHFDEHPELYEVNLSINLR